MGDKVNHLLDTRHLRRKKVPNLTRGFVARVRLVVLKCRRARRQRFTYRIVRAQKWTATAMECLVNLSGVGIRLLRVHNTVEMNVI